MYRIPFYLQREMVCAYLSDPELYEKEADLFGLRFVPYMKVRFLKMKAQKGSSEQRTKLAVSRKTVGGGLLTVVKIVQTCLRCHKGSHTKINVFFLYLVWNLKILGVFVHRKKCVAYTPTKITPFLC